MGKGYSNMETQSLLQSMDLTKFPWGIGAFSYDNIRVYSIKKRYIINRNIANKKRRKKMKWYTKLALIFAGYVVWFIVYDQLTEGNLIYKTITEGTQGKPPVLRFTVKTQTFLMFLLFILPSRVDGETPMFS